MNEVSETNMIDTENEGRETWGLTPGTNGEKTNKGMVVRYTCIMDVGHKCRDPESRFQSTCFSTAQESERCFFIHKMEGERKEWRGRKKKI